MTENIPKKRGRKPKNFNAIKQYVIKDTVENTEEEKIIYHLPLTIDDINENEKESDIDIFIKNENIININSESSESINKYVNSESINSVNKYGITNINKIITHTLKFNKNIKCWWCKNCFDSPSIQLPEDYYNNTFFCIGHFCSFNCMKTYNLDLNDILTWKRESLINLLYFKTYGEYIHIITAPHWIALDEYGGPLSIIKFRENSIINTKDYLILHPPLISRQMQIEESYKLTKLKEVSIDKINKIYSEVDSDFTIKRSKPIVSTQLNLEMTMGLTKGKKNNKL